MKYKEIKEGIAKDFAQGVGQTASNVIDKLQAKTGMAGVADLGGDKPEDEKGTNKDSQVPDLRKLKTGSYFLDNKNDAWIWGANDETWTNYETKATIDKIQGYNLFNKAKPDRRHIKESILKESNNVFKTDPKDRESRLTTRIPTPAVRPTVDAIEKIVGLEFVDEDLLGSTGKKSDPDGTFEKNSSGDLDLNTDLNKISKQELIAKLVAWCKQQGIPDDQIMNKGNTFTAGWIKDAGDQVHFRMPIQGGKGFVQTDFMLSDDPDYQRGAKRGGTEQYTGKDRAIVLSSIARGRGLKFSPKFGLVDPNRNDEVVAKNWDEIAKILLGPTATEKDTHTVESMLDLIIKLPEYEKLVAQAKESGIELPSKGEQ